MTNSKSDFKVTNESDHRILYTKCRKGDKSQS